MGGGQFVAVEFFAARGAASLAVEAGKSLRSRCVTAALLRGANGVCLVAAMRAGIRNDVVRSRCGKACRLASRPEFLLTTEDCAHAASKAAARLAANSRPAFRTATTDIKAASGWRPASVPTHETPAQPTQAMKQAMLLPHSVPPAPDQAGDKSGIQSGRIRDRRDFCTASTT